MRVLVCGGREFGKDLFDYKGGRQVYKKHGEPERALLRHWLEKLKPSLVIQGGAQGADRLAESWAMEHSVPCLNHPANWDLHGRSAGSIRNIEMLQWNPDLVLAFPGGHGTAHMVRQAKKAGIKVIEVQADGTTIETQAS